jgi:hypothetical protein
MPVNVASCQGHALAGAATANVDVEVVVVVAIASALKKAGVVFIAENGGGASVRLRKRRV